MKGNRIQYQPIKKLPADSLSVANYAKLKGITVAYVYKLFKQGKIEIVDFQGYNFVTQ